MILDTSVLIALLLGEPDAAEIAAVIDAEPLVGVGAPTLVETTIVLESRLGTDAETLLHALLDQAAAEVIPFDAIHWSVAVDAFRRYGKGRHPAALNLGDCLTYAVASRSGRTLLCKGGDFEQTDLRLAM